MSGVKSLKIYIKYRWQGLYLMEDDVSLFRIVSQVYHLLLRGGWWRHGAGIWCLPLSQTLRAPARGCDHPAPPVRLQTSLHNSDLTHSFLSNCHKSSVERCRVCTRDIQRYLVIDKIKNPPSEKWAPAEADPKCSKAFKKSLLPAVSWWTLCCHSRFILLIDSDSSSCYF